MRFLDILRELIAPKGWQIGPVAWLHGFWPHSYSKGMPVHAAPGPVITFNGPDQEAHYVTRPTGAIRGSGIRMAYHVAGEFHPVSDPAAPPTISLFFQRDGDDWSGRGDYETCRWYAATQTITPGGHVIEARLDERWGAVMGSNSIDSPQAFRDALANACRIGFVLGAAGGLGHGVWSDAGRITVTSFEVLA